jgi:hypothetical protein
VWPVEVGGSEVCGTSRMGDSESWERGAGTL